jgi:ParB-like chromosome segregation protein Spo0J
MTTDDYGLIPIDSIKWTQRQRKKFSQRKIEELGDSINRTDGPLQAPMVTRDGHNGVYGFRRWMAAKMKGHTHIMCRLTDEKDPRKLLLWEIEENVRRQDLEWDDDAESVLNYYELQHEYDKNWNQDDTGESLGMHQTLVSGKMAVA